MSDDGDEGWKSDDDVKPELPFETKKKWTNRERVLVLSSRGVSYRDRHLMNDLRTLMPHSKGESKVDKKEKLIYLNEVAEMKNCSKCIYFEARKKQDLYVWFSNVGRGPSAKFLVQNIHTSGELKLSGNCLKGSRPLLSFEKVFDDEPHYQVLKELFTQIFSTPDHHPKSQPFFDHVLNFSIQDKRIWFRNYQIVDEATNKLEEIGPRLVLQLIKIFEGGFGGPVLYDNADYVCPNTLRRQKRFSTADKYASKVRAKAQLSERRVDAPDTYPSDPIFDAVYGASSDPVHHRETVEQPDRKPGGEKSEVRRIKRKIDTVRRAKDRKKKKLGGKKNSK